MLQVNTLVTVSRLRRDLGPTEAQAVTVSRMAHT